MAFAMDSCRRRNVSNAEVQCSLPTSSRVISNQLHGMETGDRVLWMQRSIFQNGRFISVREVGTQTDHGTGSHTLESSSTGFNMSSGYMVDSGKLARDAIQPVGPFLSSNVSSRNCSKRSANSARNLTAVDIERAEEEVRQSVLGMTEAALDRACALEEHVEDLNQRATEALITARHFQNQFNLSHAFERIATVSRQNSKSPRRNKMNGAVSSTTLPDLWPPQVSVQSSSSSVGRGKDAIKMPWHELQDVLSSCPSAVTGCKIMSTGIEPWKPSISGLPPVPPLHERLSQRTSVYSQCRGASRGGSLSPRRGPSYRFAA